MKAIYKQKGESLDYTNNGTAAIEAGELVVIVLPDALSRQVRQAVSM